MPKKKVRKKTTMKIADFDAVSKIAERVNRSVGRDVFFEEYRVVLRVGKSRFVLIDRSVGEGGREVEISSVSEELAKQEAIQILAMGGWTLVNDEGLVLEVERVYATRYDCSSIEPEGVRQGEAIRQWLSNWCNGDKYYA